MCTWPWTRCRRWSSAARRSRACLVAAQAPAAAAVAAAPLGRGSSCLCRAAGPSECFVEGITACRMAVAAVVDSEVGTLLCVQYQAALCFLGDACIRSKAPCMRPCSAQVPAALAASLRRLPVQAAAPGRQHARHLRPDAAAQAHRVQVGRQRTFAGWWSLCSGLPANMEEQGFGHADRGAGAVLRSSLPICVWPRLLPALPQFVCSKLGCFALQVGEADTPRAVRRKRVEQASYSGRTMVVVYQRGKKKFARGASLASVGNGVSAGEGGGNGAVRECGVWVTSVEKAGAAGECGCCAALAGAAGQQMCSCCVTNAAARMG